MRISDWSSDVCSSDLPLPAIPHRQPKRACRHPLRPMPALRHGARESAGKDRPYRHARNQPDQAGIAEPTTQAEEHTSELQTLMRISYAVFCLKKKTTPQYRTPNELTALTQTEQRKSQP